MVNAPYAWPRNVRKRRILVIEDFSGSVHSLPTENAHEPQASRFFDLSSDAGP